MPPASCNYHRERNDMNITIAVKGVSPLLMHNPRMVDPDFEINIKIKELTRKKNKTEEDRREIERLEWYGGIYTDTNGDGKPIVVQPTSKLRKSAIEAARISRQGKDVERALLFDGVYTPLIHNGPRGIDELWRSQQYISRLSVVLSGKRIMRVRPQFFPCALYVFNDIRFAGRLQQIAYWSNQIRMLIAL